MCASETPVKTIMANKSKKEVIFLLQSASIPFRPIQIAQNEEEGKNIEYHVKGR